MRRGFAALLGAMAWAACATPGTEVAFQPDDFALVEVQLQG